MTFTYADVDGSDDPVGAAGWMDTFGAWPAVRAYKARTVELLHGCAPVVDVGCGVGDDARAIGAIGLDPSGTMLDAARRRGGEYLRGAVHALPLRSDRVGAVRTDRVLQHVPDPHGALGELARVLRPGGLAVLAEPDQATLAIDGTDPALTPAIVHYRATEGIRNGFLAGELADRLLALGFHDVDREAHRIEIRDPALSLGVVSWPWKLAERGEWSEDEANRFLHSLASPEFCYSFDVVITWGRK